MATVLLSGIDAVPTDLITVGARLGAQMEADPKLLLGAQLEAEDDRLFVRYRGQPGDPLNGRARFSIAHEYGHAYLERVAPGLDQINGDYEQFCDRFAEELLMPQTPFRTQLDAMPLTPERIDALSRTFGVSVQAAAVRCSRFIELGAMLGDQDGVDWATGRLSRPSHIFLDRLQTLLAVGKLRPEVMIEHHSGGARRWILEGATLRRKALLTLRPENLRSGIPLKLTRADAE